MTSHTNPTEKQLLELGKKLQQFYDSGYVSKKQALLFSFYKGVASGFGAFLGGSIIIGLLLWALSLGSHLPLVNHVANSLHQLIKAPR